MKIVGIPETLKLSSPHPFAMLVAGEKKAFNVMAVSWYTIASLKPPKMLVCLSDKGYTGELIRKFRHFTLCLPTEKISEMSMNAGKMTGRDADKVKALGISWIWPEGFAVPAADGSSLAWSLTLCDTMSAGDHTVYLADIESAAHISDEKHLYAFNAYSQLRTVEMK